MYKEPLPDVAQRLFKDNEQLQSKWIEAVHWLRNCSTRGWVYDKEICKVTTKEQRSEGYAV